MLGGTTRGAASIHRDPDGRYYVTWLGFRHGGTHERLEDADAHRAELTQASEAERNDWHRQHLPNQTEG